jgi:uncharacterized membrane protein YgcG
MPRSKATLLLLSLATAFVPATLFAQNTAAQSTNGAVPGSLNFVQGQANIDGRPIDTSNIDIAHPRVLHTGETLATANGSADVLLAPGALLRVGQDTTVKMVAEDAHRTEVRLDQGRANVSVNTVRHDDLLLVDMPNGQTQILSRGLYTFNGATNTVRVFNGEADVFRGADTNSDAKPVKVKESHEIILGGDRAKPAKFDRTEADEDLLPWTGPKETQAALADRGVMYGSGPSYSYAEYYPGAYGFYGPYAYGGPFLYDGYAWGPYGFYGYPFFGVGFGFWGSGFYGGYAPGYFRGYPIHGPRPVGGFRGGYVGSGHAFAGGGIRSGGFAGGGFRSGGFGGGGFHGGGGHR